MREPQSLCRACPGILIRVHQRSHQRRDCATIPGGADPTKSDRGLPAHQTMPVALQHLDPSGDSRSFDRAHPDCRGRGLVSDQQARILRQTDEFRRARRDAGIACVKGLARAEHGKPAPGSIIPSEAAPQAIGEQPLFPRREWFANRLDQPHAVRVIRRGHGRPRGGRDHDRIRHRRPPVRPDGVGLGTGRCCQEDHHSHGRPAPAAPGSEQAARARGGVAAFRAGQTGYAAHVVPAAGASPAPAGGVAAQGPHEQREADTRQGARSPPDWRSPVDEHVSSPAWGDSQIVLAALAAFLGLRKIKRDLHVTRQPKL
jgi:hypothetical protein